MKNHSLAALLENFGLAPVLVDIGVSGDSLATWNPIASQSHFLGFDPDARERPAYLNQFKTAQIVAKAVTDEEKEEIDVFLTRFPFCSSTLEPDAAALSQYQFAPLFEVESRVQCGATTLQKALAEAQLPRLDWLKCDTQGTDGRLFISLPDPLRQSVLALDVEPGLVDAYHGEDLWAPLHIQLLQLGFWPSRLNLCGVPRGQESSLHKAGTSWGEQNLNVRMSPVWMESRYLRTLESVQNQPLETIVLLGVFALLDEQSGFALDVAAHLEDNGHTAPAVAVRSLALAQMKALQGRRQRDKWLHLPSRVVNKIKRATSQAKS